MHLLSATLALSIALLTPANFAQAFPGAVKIRTPGPIRQTDLRLTASDATKVEFQAWISAFRGRAPDYGISQEILSQALDGIKYKAKIVALDRRQSDFTKTIGQYLDGAVSEARIQSGQKMLKRYATLLGAIEKRYGVDKEVLVAIWGLETAYGGFRGKSNTIASLATLAFDGRRSAFFENELIAALKILTKGDTTVAKMKGSWAGAMGHTQFMPNSYLQHAVDFDGDGRRDIWSNDPTDALASTAAYLRNNGWKPGQPWAIEVLLPDKFDYRLANPGIQKSLRVWESLGVKVADGRVIGAKGRASIFLPAGADGPALMAFSNFDTIRSYNITPTYIISVGLLSDVFKGQAVFTRPWPITARLLSLAERKEMQALLLDKGFHPGRTDGKINPNFIQAVQDYQVSRKLRPDGYPSPKLLNRLRKDAI